MNFKRDIIPTGLSKAQGGNDRGSATDRKKDMET